ncbi:MAG TPA: hypothetical protein VGF43_10245 [Dongiaceae bacterium]|jgi:hypothetical protein
MSGVCYVDGEAPVDIERLISPLRYDVVVRKRFFDLLQDERALYERDPERFVSIAARSGYYTWFEKVYCRRFEPALLRNDPARRAAFRKRVHASARLYSSFEQHGFIANRRIILRTGCEILPADSGKLVSANIFAGDGCHRLALLLKSGIRTIEPAQYVLKVSPRYSPLDNTALLLNALPLSMPEYAAFLSASYSTGRHESLEELVDAVGTGRPQRLIELKQVIAADLPSFHVH